jgi:hypothetical protein
MGAFRLVKHDQDPEKLGLIFGQLQYFDKPVDECAAYFFPLEHIVEKAAGIGKP